MIHDLNYPVPLRVPNPPPWGIDYVNEMSDRLWYDGILPEAHTKGLDRFKKPELSIRFAPPNIAAALLDRVAVWLVYEGRNHVPGDRFNFSGIEFALVTNDALCRVSWERDQVLA